jgi:bifunctional non-homologous end joining protein LigD
MPNMELMLCTLVDEPFDDPNWTFEPKLDGLRVLCKVNGKRVQLISRRGNDQATQFPEIVQAMQASAKSPAVFDGEIVCLDEKERSSFRLLQQRFHVQDPRTIEMRAKQYPAVFYLFDILSANGADLTPLPLRDRRKRLEKSLKWSKRIRLIPSTPEKGIALFRQMCREGQEGIIAKRLDSPYVGGRSRDWVKIKCIGRQEFVIGGFTEPQRSRVGLGALLVGYYDDQKKLIYAGKVGTGYTTEILKDLRQRLEKLEQPKNPFDAGNPPKGVGVHWVKPTLVAEIAFAEWTQNDKLRQPRFEGLRMDKKATDVKRERPRQTQREVHPRKTAKTNPNVRKPRTQRVKNARDSVTFTHVEKVMFPEKGFTKGDVLNYYETVAPLLLPHLKDRPVTLERLPNGVREGAPKFWQKNTPSYYPSWIPRADFPTEEGKPVQYVLINDVRTLLYLVNQGALTFHTWLSRTKSPERPDYVLFDFDPGEAKFSDVVKIAQQVRVELEAEGAKAFVKTSGKSGLHVMTPWKSKGGFDEARNWAITVAQRLVNKLPKIATMERSKEARHGRVYVDVMQNAKGKHVVPPYVVRATPAASVSTPLDWKEVNGKLNPQKFDLETALKRFARRKDPLAALTGAS